MGSGQGKSKRVLTSAAGERLGIHLDKWNAFVRDQNIGNVKFADYYDAKLSDTAFGPIDDAPLLAGLATEFFQDLVGTGTVTLPSGVRTEDFEFDVRMVQRHPALGEEEMLMLMVKHKGTQREIQCSRTPDYALNPHINLSSVHLRDLVLDIGESARIVSRGK